MLCKRATKSSKIARATQTAVVAKPGKRGIIEPRTMNYTKSCNVFPRIEGGEIVDYQSFQFCDTNGAQLGAGREPSTFFTAGGL
eukprot:9052342-Pyramimonas_sp.AAC.1